MDAWLIPGEAILPELFNTQSTKQADITVQNTGPACARPSGAGLRRVARGKGRTPGVPDVCDLAWRRRRAAHPRRRLMGGGVEGARCACAA